MSAAALRALHVPGDPLVLPNAWDAATARARRRRPASRRSRRRAAASPRRSASRTASRPGGGDARRGGARSPARSTCRSPPTWRPATGSPAAELAQRLAATGAVGLNLEDTDHARHPALVPVAAPRRAHRRDQGAPPTSCSTPASTSTCAAATTAEALERARAYPAAGADCVYPIGVADEATIAAFVGDRRSRSTSCCGPGAPPIARLAELGVARVSLGHFLHAEMLDALPKRRTQPPRYAFVIGMRRSRPNARGVILMPGGAWRRLYSARSTSAKTRADRLLGQPGQRELLAARVLLDVGLEDRVERVVVGQRVGVLLVGPQLGARRAVDDRARHRAARRRARRGSRRAGRRASWARP